jgi:hypothetical protein
MGKRSIPRKPSLRTVAPPSMAARKRRKESEKKDVSIQFLPCAAVEGGATMEEKARILLMSFVRRAAEGLPKISLLTIN